MSTTTQQLERQSHTKEQILWIGIRQGLFAIIQALDVYFEVKNDTADHL